MRRSRCSTIGRRTVTAAEEVEAIVDWYLDKAYRRWEGPNVTPFFADRQRVGHFAVDLDLLQRGEERALFRLLVALSMYQSRRDIDIMAIQRGMLMRTVDRMTSPSRLRVLVEQTRCPQLVDASTFGDSCDVARIPGRSGATCGTRPRLACHVKEATTAIGRMGDMGKLPTSAWLSLGGPGVRGALDQVCREERDPGTRAERLVERFVTIHRVGTKLASLFVSALSTPELNGIAPWHPTIDGAQLVVVDGNVSAAVAIWRGPRARRTYDATAKWIQQLAGEIQRRSPAGPRRSPRFVQQAIYVFRSRFNRVAAGDPCATRPCASCPSRVCPFR